MEGRIHVVADGAEWIAIQCREVFGDQVDLLTDFYHVSEYLAAAAAACRPASPRTWLHTQQRRLKRGAIDQVLAAMANFLEAPDIAEDLAPVRAATRYLTNRRDALDYPAAIANGLPVGSGMIESAHKHVLHSRLKNAGTAWLPENAHDIAQLRVLRANHLWDHFWDLPLAA